MPVDRAVTARGALAGALAATVWAAQQPLDKRVFGVDYDDCELLGSAVTGGRGALPLGWAMHALNGAAFGAVYANVAPRMPLPSWARGPAAGLAENFASWPGTAFIGRLHPRGSRFPKLFGSNAALAQATWRHALFGVVLGEVERRLNAEPAVEEPLPFSHVVSTNGHGNIEHAVVALTIDEDDDGDLASDDE